MTTNDSTLKSIFASREQVTAALVRAGNNARLLAEQMGTKLIVVTPPQTPNAANNSMKSTRSVNNEN